MIRAHTIWLFLKFELKWESKVEDAGASQVGSQKAILIGMRVDGSGRVTLWSRRFLRPDPSTPDSVTPTVVDPLFNQQVHVIDQSQDSLSDSQDCLEPAASETQTNEPESSWV